MDNVCVVTRVIDFLVFDVKTLQKMRYVSTAFMDAIDNYSDNVWRRVLKFYGLDMYVPFRMEHLMRTDFFGKKHLLLPRFALADYSHGVKMLLDNMTKKFEVAYNNLPAIAWALQNGNEYMIDILLDKINVNSYKPTSPIYYAIEKKNIGLLEKLIAKGCVIHQSHNTIIRRVANAIYAHEHSDNFYVDDYIAPLCYAIKLSQFSDRYFEIVRYLFELDKNGLYIINYMEQANGNNVVMKCNIVTALNYAIMCNSVRTVKLLMELGADDTIPARYCEKEINGNVVHVRDCERFFFDYSCVVEENRMLV